MKQPVAWGRLAFIVAGIVPAAFLFWRGPAISDGVTSPTLGILATVFSILAGFLMAVITMLGDPRGVYMGSWRTASAHRRQIKNALQRFVMLFYAYLATILAAFAAALLEEYDAGGICVSWVRHFALSLGFATLVWSFSLPIVIFRTQMNRLDEEVEERRSSSDTTV